MVHGVIDAALARKDELGDGDKGVALLEQGLNDAGQRLRSVLGGIMKQDDGTGLDLGGDPLGDFGGRKIFPVQAVPVPNKGKPLGRPSFRGCSILSIHAATDGKGHGAVVQRWD